MAKHTASALLEYVRSGSFLPHDKISANVNYIFIGDRDDITVGVPPIANHSAYSLVNAVVSYTIGIPLNHVRNEEVFARVKNLMDRNYSEAFGFKAPTINVLAGSQAGFRVGRAAGYRIAIAVEVRVFRFLVSESDERNRVVETVAKYHRPQIVTAYDE